MKAKGPFLNLTSWEEREEEEQQQQKKTNVNLAAARLLKKCYQHFLYQRTFKPVSKP